MTGELYTLNLEFIIHDAGYFTYLSSVIPVICYKNADTQKESVLEENRNKAGVYR